MKCPVCNSEVSEKDNFCMFCGEKLKKECFCWIKKDTYNCGESKCPGYDLHRKKLFQSRKHNEEIKLMLKIVMGDS